MNIKTKHGIGFDHGVIKKDRKEFRYLEYKDGKRFIPLEVFALEEVSPTDKEMTRMYAVETWAAIAAGKMRTYAEDQERKAAVLAVLK